MLTKDEITKLIDNQKIVFSPLLDRDLQIHHGRVDFRLGVMFMVAQHNRSASVNPLQQARSKIPLERYQFSIYVPLGKTLVLHPGETILGSTLEYISLPKSISGMIAVRSSWSRLGLTIAPGLIVNPGSKSCLTLELSNHAQEPIELVPGSRIGHLILDHLDNEEEQAESRYDFAIGPEYSKLDLDPEMKYLGEYPTIVGITGPINSGKTEIANYLATKLGFVLRSTSMALQEQMKHINGKIDSDNKYMYKIKIRDAQGDEILAVKALQEAMKDNPKGIVLDSVDHPAEIKFLRNIPSFHLISTNADKQWRFQRYNTSARTEGDRELSFTEFEEIDQRQYKSLDIYGEFSSHADNIETCLRLSDYPIILERDIRKNEEKLDRFISLRGLLR